MGERELTAKQFKSIVRQGLFTGSRRFKQLVTPDSDWDYVFHVDTLVHILPEVEVHPKRRRLEEKEGYEHDPTVFFTLTYRYKGRVINLVVVHNQWLLEAWDFATRIFCQNSEAIARLFPDQQSKTAKHLFFQQIKHGYVKQAEALRKRIGAGEEEPPLKNTIAGVEAPF